MSNQNDEPKHHLDALEAILVLASGVAHLADVAIEGIGRVPGKIYNDVGIYVEHKPSIVTRTGQGGQIELVGIQVPIKLAAHLGQSLQVYKQTDEGRAMVAKLGADLGVSVTVGGPGRVM